MTSLCERPGCSEPGAAAYGMRAEDLLFWVDHLDAGADQEGRVLCRRHADAMVVPRGWTLDDRREPMPRLFRPPVTRPAHGPSPRQAARRGPSTSPEVPRGEQLALDDVASMSEVVEGTVVEGTVVEGTAVESGPVEAAAVWSPSFDHDDDLDGLLEVRSPLLARAFRGADRPRRA